MMNTKTIGILLMILTTVLTSVAQVSYKFGAQNLSLNFVSIFFNLYLVVGLLLYIIGGILMIIALKYGEVSILFPIVSTSYIWVGLMSNLFFKEIINAFKFLGIVLIVIGIISLNINHHSSEAAS